MDRAAVALVDLVLGLEVGAARAVPALVVPLVHEPVLAHPRQHLLHLRHVLRVGRADEEVVRRLDPRRERLEALGVAVRQLLGLDPERVRRVGDRLAVLVGAGQEEHLLAALAVMARHHVGGDRRVRVPQMRRRVDVVDRGGDVVAHSRSRLLAERCAAPTTSTTSPLGRDARRSASRQLGAPSRARLPRGAWSARGTPPRALADRRRASISQVARQSLGGLERHERLLRCPPAGARARRACAAGSRRIASARPAAPRATNALSTALGPGSTSTGRPSRDARLHQRDSRGRRPAACPRR